MEKEKTIRTPRNSDSILAGALKLPLISRTELCKKLHTSIDTEVMEIQKEAEVARQLLSQLNGKS